MAQDLQVRIDQVVFCNKENGYTVARATDTGSGDTLTVVGTLVSARPGETLKLQGEWTRHPRFGRQFAVSLSDTVVPVTAEGIEKYLGSGCIRGIGPVMAQRIVQRFGTEAVAVIDRAPERLAEIDGIGPARIAGIREAWREQQDVRSVMLFLQSHNVGVGYAAKIYKRYGKGAIALVRENPYRLADDIAGIGFVIADRIAGRLGMDARSARRVEAGLLHVLGQLGEQGHVCYPSDPLIERCREMLAVDRELVEQALALARVEKKIVIENVDAAAWPEGSPAVYCAPLHACETAVAERLRALKQCTGACVAGHPDTEVTRVQQDLAIRLADRQSEALRLALTEKVLVVTGGPGTGKTTIISALVRMYARLRLRVLLAAPTGRAAKRMQETSGHTAMTIHRMLQYSVHTGCFEKNRANPLDCDALIVDESSMIDTVLMCHLLQAVPSGARLILVGDVHQLPSVGPGTILRDSIDSGAVPVIELKDIFRQARQSRIIVNAHRINAGLLPEASGDVGEGGDFFCIERNDPESAVDTILKLVSERIPQRFGFDPVNDIQVLSPMHKGHAGIESLNRHLQALLNPGTPGVVRGSRQYHLHDKIMQVRNDYTREVFNGDIGRIAGIDQVRATVSVSFEGRLVEYDAADLDDLALAYAVSVHKAQGSEFPAVVMPLLTQHYVLLQRNLLYTAVTRGRRLVVLVGSKRALAIAVHNNKTLARYTGLRMRLREPEVSP